MNTKEAFKDLISNRKWYDGLGISETAAWSLAKAAKDGRSISTDKMEDLLEKAGYKVVQEKKWGK